MTRVSVVLRINCQPRVQSVYEIGNVKFKVVVADCQRNECQSRLTHSHVVSYVSFDHSSSALAFIMPARIIEAQTRLCC